MSGSSISNSDNENSEVSAELEEAKTESSTEEEVETSSDDEEDANDEGVSEDDVDDEVRLKPSTKARSKKQSSLPVSDSSDDTDEDDIIADAADEDAEAVSEDEVVADDDSVSEVSTEPESVDEEEIKPKKFKKTTVPKYRKADEVEKPRKRHGKTGNKPTADRDVESESDADETTSIKKPKTKKHAEPVFIAAYPGQTTVQHALLEQAAQIVADEYSTTAFPENLVRSAVNYKLKNSRYYSKLNGDAKNISEVITS